MIVIISCKKNLYKQNAIKKTWLKEINLNYVFVTGDPTIKSNYILNENNLIINCDDTYDSLTTKVSLAIKYCYFIFNPEFILKIDDDVIVNPQLLRTYLNSIPKNVDYGGKLAIKYKGEDNKIYYSKFNNKPENTTNNFDITFCGGPVYYLSRNSINLLSKIYVKCNTYFEDVDISLALFNNNIFATSLKLYTDFEKEYLNNNYPCFHPKS